MFVLISSFLPLMFVAILIRQCPCTISNCAYNKSMMAALEYQKHTQQSSVPRLPTAAADRKCIKQTIWPLWILDLWLMTQPNLPEPPTGHDHLPSNPRICVCVTSGPNGRDASEVHVTSWSWRPSSAILVGISPLRQSISLDLSPDPQEPIPTLNIPQPSCSFVQSL